LKNGTVGTNLTLNSSVFRAGACSSLPFCNSKVIFHLEGNQRLKNQFKAANEEGLVVDLTGDKVNAEAFKIRLIKYKYHEKEQDT
jgi:hypothetical protein